MGDMLLCFGVLYLPLFLIAFGVPVIGYLVRRRGARRKKRRDRQHASRVPYRYFGYFCLVLTLGMAGLVVVGFFRGFFEFPDDLDTAIGFLFLPMLAAIVSFRNYVLQNMPSAAEAVVNDPRPSVLYLRSFDQEPLKFVDLKKEERARYNDYLNYADDVQLPEFEKKVFNLLNDTATSLFSSDAVYGDDITFEKYFRAEVLKQIGPFVALGNPIDSIPAEGAYRDYQIDERWKDVFYERADTCACILMQLGNSDNLQFELTAIIARGLRQKLFVITPPQKKVKDRNAWLRKYILREKPANWETFSVILMNNGYLLPDEPLGVGSVLTFEPDGRPLVLVRGAFQPGEYITPIHERLKDLKIISGS